MYRWDAQIQDRLVSWSDRLANAYELGGALAETYWALDPAAPPRVQLGRYSRLNPVSWEFLFGADRRADVALLLGRLAPNFAPLAAPAVAGSVEVWGQVAANEQWRALHTRPHYPVLKAVVAAFGVLSVTDAGLQARLKATTQSMAARLSADLSTELVAEQITVTPAAPRSVNIKRTRQKAIGSRTVTAPLRR